MFGQIQTFIYIKDFPLLPLETSNKVTFKRFEQGKIKIVNVYLALNLIAHFTKIIKILIT